MPNLELVDVESITKDSLSEEDIREEDSREFIKNNRSVTKETLCAWLLNSVKQIEELKSEVYDQKSIIDLQERIILNRDREIDFLKNLTKEEKKPTQRSAQTCIGSHSLVLTRAAAGSAAVQKNRQPKRLKKERCHSVTTILALMQPLGCTVSPLTGSCARMPPK